MIATIQSQLRQIEKAEGVRVLYACEAGSRAWGFPSADSDYDVRFLYLRPLEWYLTIDPSRDVIERPINHDLDITGWDLRKALLLLRKSNPPLVEWLQSPIVYWEETSAARRMRALIPSFYAPASAARHYLRMAQRQHGKYLESEKKGLKSLFYVLRALLALRWLEKGCGVVPTEFQQLVDRLIEDQTLRGLIEVLRVEKTTASERDPARRIDEIHRLVESEFSRWETQALPDATAGGETRDLDHLFRAVLNECWEQNLPC